MKKRILILAGGVASRMKKDAENLTGIEEGLIRQANTLTKGMIQVGKAGKSLMDYLLYNAAQEGFEQALLLLHPEDSLTQAYYENLMRENKTWGLEILFARQHIAPDRVKPAGTADAVEQTLHQHLSWQKGRFVVCNSDNLYSREAIRLLWNCSQANALISYDRKALHFPEDRIKAFALIKTDADGFLKAILEKPSDEQVEEEFRQSGRVGVSMNIFVLEASQFFSYLQRTPFHPVRNERELPTAINMFLADHPKEFFTLPLAENVPDLTSKQDISLVQAYLDKNYPSHF